ncbi:MAG TPA: GNAT family N-acetyltransferase [Pyrinomonadaceae bacterium]
MTEHDLLEVVAIEESCGLSLWGWDAYRAELDRPESIMLVARREAPTHMSEQRLRGFIAARVQAGELHVNNIGVREGERRQGVGGFLLGRALRVGAHYGAGAALLEVRVGNAAAQALYRAHGFVVTGRRRGYYKEPREDALVMARRLETEA